MTDLIPDELLFKIKKSQVIELLQALDVRPRLKKECFIAWAKVVEYNFTADDINVLLGIESYRA